MRQMMVLPISQVYPDKPTSPAPKTKEYESEYEWEARDTIKWYIHRLRRKVEPDRLSPRHILNVRGVGYMFEG